MLGHSLVATCGDELAITPCCSPHSRAAATRHWVRLNVEDPAGWSPLREAAPEFLLYCGGVCDVGRCDADPDYARRINVGGVAAMLDALPDATRLVYCGSDHVFPGDDGPYTESTPARPLSVYGRTRVEAEDLVMHRRPDAVLVRVGLPIGPSFGGRTGHLDWLRHRHAAGLPMTIVADEARAAVWAADAARRILALARADVRGIRHLVADEPCARPELAAHLCTRLGIEPRYEVITRRDLSRPHLGRVDLRTEHTGPLATPLASPLTSPLASPLRS
jgi:dTDP-4-dehydrorhamnose reductase